jgi:hypothetical protein
MRNKIITYAAAGFFTTVLLLTPPAARAQGTKFTYQGRLLDAGTPVSGIRDMRFTVWTAAAGPVELASYPAGPPPATVPVSISGGLFTVAIDFGPGIFTGPPRYLQIESPAGTIIGPRQELTATPYAISAGIVNGPVGDLNLSPNVALLNRNPQTFTGQNNFGNNVAFLDDTSSLIFPPVSGVNAPMVFMFASGIANADRMVIGHSPGFPNWGLQYQDSFDKFNFLSAGANVMTVDLGNSRVGIGTDTPGAPLDLFGSEQAYARLQSANTANGSVLELRNDTRLRPISVPLTSPPPVPRTDKWATGRLMA